MSATYRAVSWNPQKRRYDLAAAAMIVGFLGVAMAVQAVLRPELTIETILIRALGANPTPLSYGEIFSALQTKLIDGAENNWTTFQTSRHFEVARFWSQSEHSYSPEAVLMSQRRYDKLTKRQQELVRAAAAQSVPYMRTLWDSSEAEARAAVEKAGIRATPVNRAAFQKVAAPIVESYMKDPQLQRIYQEIRAVA